MSTENIGINAGSVWNVLNEKGEMDVKALKKSTKLSEKDLNMALGWLAREGKIEFNETEESLLVHLV
ncbi:MAG TPA: winged helix-turn-helix domain-containing protein [Paludibacteraceae bacterium]|jgi:transcription initiation factor IIE alpha subunit|nr:winged helix-turn-helix domain-containing protein [Paludibacteraceae bacterium]MBP9017127.1 winged helix-turn-helix domain-containing protein [Paludibacteraceae bacterium]MDS1033026.1 winged helix-turn-helix domain-containing protein [Porphyromonadaceae sp. NP-X]NLJ20891.1 winged helix-turn-helix domain-containing protein [Bacteroidales bacterium]HOH55897.1 winged helix-turn-helix domain-containing protein [Paludibacteraceae bacterium]